MAYKGFKIEQEGYVLEVIGVEKITDYVSNIKYVVKKGNNVLTESYIFVTNDQDSRKMLKETLQSIINAIKRIPTP